MSVKYINTTNYGENRTKADYFLLNLHGDDGQKFLKDNPEITEALQVEQKTFLD